MSTNKEKKPQVILKSLDQLAEINNQVKTEEEQKKIESLIQNSSSIPELYKTIKNLGGIQGSSEFYSTNQILKRIRAYINNETDENTITRTGGLREKVKELKLQSEANKNQISKKNNAAEKKSEVFGENFKTINVQRSNGEIEQDWKLINIQDGKAIVMKKDAKTGDIIRKVIPQIELERLNPEQNNSKEIKTNLKQEKWTKKDEEILQKTMEDMDKIQRTMMEMGNKIKKEEAEEKRAKFDELAEKAAELLEKRNKISPKLAKKPRKNIPEGEFETREEYERAKIKIKNREDTKAASKLMHDIFASKTEEKEVKSESKKLTVDEQIEAAKARVSADINKRADEELEKTKKEQEEADKKAAEEKESGENKKEWREEDLTKARTEYAEEFKKFMAERKESAGFFKKIGRKFFGSKVKEGELTEELKKLEGEYNKNIVAFGNKMFADKKSELEKSGATKEAIELQLERFKKTDIFNKVIIEEQKELSALKAENLPPKERNVLQKALHWYFSPSKGQDTKQQIGKRIAKTAISIAVTAPIIYAITPAAIAAAGGFASYLAIRGVRAGLGIAATQLGRSGFEKIFKDKTATKRIKEETVLAEKYGLGEKELSLDQLQAYKKEHAKILETEQKRKRNRLIHKSLVSLGFGGITSLSLTEIAHNLTPEQVLAGEVPQGTKVTIPHENIQNKIPVEKTVENPNVPKEEIINKTEIKITEDKNYTAPTQVNPEGVEEGTNVAPVQVAPEEAGENQVAPNIAQNTAEQPVVSQENIAKSNINQETNTIELEPDNTTGEQYGIHPKGAPVLTEKPVNSPGAYTEEEYRLKTEGQTQSVQKDISTEAEKETGTYTEEEYKLKPNEKIITPTEKTSETPTYTEEEYKLKTEGQAQPENINTPGQTNTYTEEEYKIKTGEQPKINTEQQMPTEKETGTYTEEEYRIKNAEQYGQTEQASATEVENQGAGTYSEKEYGISDKKIPNTQENIKPEEIQTEKTGVAQTQTEQTGTTQAAEQEKPETDMAPAETQTQQDGAPYEHKLDATGHPVEKFITEGENPYELSNEQMTEINDLYTEKMNKMFPEEKMWNWERIQNYKGMAHSILNLEKVTDEYSPLKKLLQEIHDKTGLKPVPETGLDSGTSPKEYIMKGLQYARKNNIKIKF